MKLQMDKSTQHGVLKYQYKIYLPIALVRAMGWKPGDDLEPEVMGKDKLKLERKRSSK